MTKALHRRIATVCFDLGLSVASDETLGGLTVSYGTEQLGCFIGHLLTRARYHESVSEYRAYPLLARHSNFNAVSPLARALDQLAVAPPLYSLDFVGAYMSAVQRSLRSARGAEARARTRQIEHERVVRRVVAHLALAEDASVLDVRTAIEAVLRTEGTPSSWMSALSVMTTLGDMLHAGRTFAFSSRACDILRAYGTGRLDGIERGQRPGTTPAGDAATAYAHADEIGALAQRIRGYQGPLTIERVALCVFAYADDAHDDPMSLVEGVCGRLLYDRKPPYLTPGVADVGMRAWWEREPR